MTDMLQDAKTHGVSRIIFQRDLEDRRRRGSRALAALALFAAFASAIGCKPAPPAAGLPEVAAVTLGTERVTLTTELPGRTNPYLIAEIRPQVNGILQKRLFTEGADVKAGGLLYQIDPAPYRAAYEQAKAALAVAEAKVPAARSRVERFKSLVAVHAVGQQDYDDAVSALQTAEAGVESARAAMENARINLDYTPIKSPISGRIGRSAVTVGALVNAYQGTALAVVQQLDPMYVDVIQSSAEILRLRRNMEAGRLKQDKEAWSKVSLKLEDGTAYPLQGTLQFRDITVDPTTGSVTLRAVFPNPDNVLLPGMFVRAVVEEGVNEQAVLVPQQGVSRDNKGNPYALVVGADDKVEQRSVELDRALGDKWLVAKGLAAGDRVIVEGSLKVRPGASVKVVAFEGKGGK